MLAPCVIAGIPRWSRAALLSPRRRWYSGCFTTPDSRHRALDLLHHAPPPPTPSQPAGLVQRLLPSTGHENAKGASAPAGTQLSATNATSGLRIQSCRLRCTRRVAPLLYKVHWLPTLFPYSFSVGSSSASIFSSPPYLIISHILLGFFFSFTVPGWTFFILFLIIESKESLCWRSLFLPPVDPTTKPN